MQDKEFYKYKRIVFLVETPFTARDENRFGIFQYLLKGFIVEVIDISNVYRKNNLYKIAKESLEEKDYIRNIFSVRELVSALSQNLYTTIVFLQTHHHLALIKLLNELSIDYIAHSVNQIPSIDVDETLYENLIRIFKTYSIFKLGPKIFAGVSNKIENFLLRKISNPKFILAGGKNSILIYSPRILSRSKIVWAHALDYDLYLKSIHNNIKDDFIDIFGLKYSFDELRNSIVFLDEYNPYHPDFDFLKIPHADKPEKYYPAIERFFLYLEKKYNLRVIIAAHPRSDYKSKNHFKGFPIIKDRTLDLIKISSLVLLHSSTSVNFVNIFKKPFKY
jgi:hypothetical protein